MLELRVFSNEFSPELTGTFDGLARIVFHKEKQMHKYRLHFTGSIAAMLFMFLSGCGKEAAVAPAPTILSTNPVNGATGIPIAQVVAATFSTSMNPATFTASTFTLTGPSGAVTGGVTYAASSSVASFTPAMGLAYN